MSGHTFISYSRIDRAYVGKLAAYLTAAGLEVWYDYQIVGGDRWDEVIRDQVATCAAFIVVMTPAAEASEWVTREINHAAKNERPIFPLLLAGDEFFRLNNIQSVDVTGGRMPPSEFLTRLHRLLPPRPASPPHLVLEALPAALVHVLAGRAGSLSSVARSGLAQPPPPAMARDRPVQLGRHPLAVARGVC